MGSIVEITKTSKATGKTVKQYRALIRRTGFESKSKVCATRTEAKEWLRENEATESLVKVGNRLADTFDQLADIFVASPPSPGTKYWKPSQLEYWVDRFRDVRVGDISRKDINLAVAELQVKKAHHRTIWGAVAESARVVTPATVNRYLATLSSVFNFALNREIIDIHPMKSGNVRKLTEGRGRTRILTADEESRLMEQAAASTWPPMALFLRMLLTTAARKSVVLKLRWSDVHLEDSLAILPKTKNGEPRALPLIDDVKASLRDAQKIRPINSDYIFFDPKQSQKPKNIDTIWRFVRERAGLLDDRDDRLDRVVLHSTRHTAVTKLVKSGANLSQVANVSGHKTLAMLKRYEHLAADDAIDLATRFLSGSKTVA
jgi:integrase